MKNDNCFVLLRGLWQWFDWATGRTSRL